MQVEPKSSRTEALTKTARSKRNFPGSKLHRTVLGGLQKVSQMNEMLLIKGKQSPSAATQPEQVSGTKRSQRIRERTRN